ncbi:TonB-dependent receptor [candidate division KSB1 bacterium]|nr:TonB-dependent receptor [candidate division KSB1 bacterium]
MYRKLSVVILLLFLLPTLALAQTGKVRGVVTDGETGEVLPGANIMIEGTSLGDAADLNGVYVVLGVPPGLYTVKASFIGYKTMSVANIRVSSNLSFTLDFALSPATIEGETVEIIAERPLVQRNTTNTVRMATQEDIKNLPLRGLQNIIGLEAGVVQQDGNLHIRGGRDGEVAYFVDGVTATNPYNNTENIRVIQEAVEEIQMQAGGYTAETEGGNSGAVRSTLRTGGSDFKATLDYRTDDFVHSGEQFLGTNSYGYRNAVVTLSGSVPGVSNLKFFVAGQHNFMRNDNPMFLEPFKLEGLVEDQYTDWTLAGVRVKGDTLPNNGVVEFKRNHLPHNNRNNNNIQGTLVYDATKNIKLRYSGSYEFRERQTGANNFYEAFDNYFSLGRRATSEDQTMMNSLRLTHLLSPTTFYEVSAYISTRQSKTYDPVFGDNWRSYTDSAANHDKGYGVVTNAAGEEVSTWRSKWVGPYNYSVIYAFTFDAEGQPITSYSKYNHNNIGLNANFHTQINSNWELSAGGRYDSWLMRRYSIGYINQLMQLDQGVDGKTPNQYNDHVYGDSEYERNVRLQKAGNATIYGYDIDGNKVNSGVHGPNKPVFASAFLQNKFEYKDLVLNVGFRYEMVDLKAIKPKQPEDPDFDTYLDWLKEEDVTRTEAYNYILPRLNFSFPVTNNTVFYALYGKFIQMPDLSLVYRGYHYMSESVSPVSRSPFGYWSSYVGYTAKPEEIVQYEMGFRKSITDNFALTVTGFYKNYNNLLRIDRVFSQGATANSPPEGDVIFCGYRNNDFSTVKGVELTLELRRTKRLAAKVNYTLSSSFGTGASPRAGEVAVSDDIQARYPLTMSLLDYHQPHRGTMMLDYRFNKGDGGSILQGFGTNLLLRFSSGHAFTKILEPENLGQADPWTIGVDNLADPRNRFPVEARNTSLTPWNFTIDLTLNKVFFFENFDVDLYVNVLNLLNTQNIINVYPNTGSTEDDGWFRSVHARSFLQIPGYENMYRNINLNNRWAYTNATGGNDMFSAPRQIRFGVRFEIK